MEQIIINSVNEKYHFMHAPPPPQMTTTTTTNKKKYIHILFKLAASGKFKAGI